MSLTILIGSNVHWWNAEAAYAAITAELLQKAGHRVFVLTRPNTLNAKHLQQRGLTLITDVDLNTYNPLRLYQSYQRLKKFLREHGVQIVNPHRSEGFFIYILLKFSLKTFKLIRTRGTTRTVRNNWFNRKIYCDWVDAHIFAGQIVLERVSRVILLPHHKTHVIYYPTDALLPVSFQPHQYYQEFQIPPECKTMAIVGRISPVKGHDLLLAGFRKLLENCPKTVLLILYKHPDPQRPELRALQEQCRNMQIEQQVRFIGPRQDIQAIMKFVDVGVVSSIDSEVICRVAVEFLSVGTPVVAFPTGCLPEIIHSNINGMLTKNQDSDSLAVALEKILSNPELLHQLSENAHQKAQDRFSQALFLEKTLNVFESV